MSKCVVSRSVRVYMVLMIGMTIGFSLSTLLQIHAVDVSRATGRLREGIADYRFPRASATFSELDARAARESDVKIDIGGYYDYERLVLQEELEKERKKDDALGVEVMAAEIKPVHNNRAKQREYLNGAWQGRNVRESNNGFTPLTLSEELTPRNTLLIAVITSVRQLMSQTLAIQGTWAVDASQVIYFIGEVETLPHLPHGMVVVQLEGLDDKHAGWNLKEIAAINYMATHYLDTTEWFLIVSDDTYVASARMERELIKHDPSMSVYMGRPSAGGASNLNSNQEEGREEEEEGGEREEEEEKSQRKLCESSSGVVYSRGFLEQLRSYLPSCWPGQAGESNSLSGCITAMDVKCTTAKQVWKYIVVVQGALQTCLEWCCTTQLFLPFPLMSQ